VSPNTGRIVALYLIASLTVMSTGIIAPALPQMAVAFAATPNVELLTKLVLTMPAIVIAFAAPLSGAIIDRYGRLPMLYGSLVLYGGAGCAGYWLASIESILASRALLGVAIGGTMTSMTALAGDYFTGEARMRFAAIQSVVMSAAAMISITLGGFLADLDWRAPFLLYGAGLLYVLPSLVWLIEPKRAMAHGASPGRASTVPWRTVGLAYGISFFAVAMFYMIYTQIPFRMRDIGVNSNTAVGTAIGVASGISAIVSLGYARLKRQLGFLAIHGVAFVSMAIGYAIIASFDDYGAVVLGIAATGIGVGLFFPNSTTWLLTIAPPALRGRLSGGLTASIFSGQFSSPLMAQPAIAAGGTAWAFGFYAAVMVVVAAALVLAASTRKEWRAA
jgi:MFS family permease